MKQDDTLLKIKTVAEAIIPHYTSQLVADDFPLDLEQTLKLLKQVALKIKDPKSQLPEDHNYPVEVLKIYDDLCALPQQLQKYDRQKTTTIDDYQKAILEVLENLSEQESFATFQNAAKSKALINITIEQVVPDYIDNFKDSALSLDMEKAISLLHAIMGFLCFDTSLTDEDKATYSKQAIEFYDEMCLLHVKIKNYDKRYQYPEADYKNGLIKYLAAEINRWEEIFELIKSKNANLPAEYITHSQYHHATDQLTKENLITAYEQLKNLRLIVKLKCLSAKQLALFSGLQLNKYEEFLSSHSDKKEAVIELFEIAKSYYPNDPEKGLKELAQILHPYTEMLVNTKRIRSLLKDHKLSYADMVKYPRIFDLDRKVLQLICECIPAERKKYFFESAVDVNDKVMEMIIDEGKEKLTREQCLLLINDNINYGSKNENLLIKTFEASKGKLTADDYVSLICIRDQNAININLKLMKSILEAGENNFTREHYAKFLNCYWIESRPEMLKSVFIAAKDKLINEDYFKLLRSYKVLNNLDLYRLILNEGQDKVTGEQYLTLLINLRNMVHANKISIRRKLPANRRRPTNASTANTNKTNLDEFYSLTLEAAQDKLTRNHFMDLLQIFDSEYTYELFKETVEILKPKFIDDVEVITQVNRIELFNQLLKYGVFPPLEWNYVSLLTDKIFINRHYMFMLILNRAKHYLTGDEYMLLFKNFTILSYPNLFKEIFATRNEKLISYNVPLVFNEAVVKLPELFKVFFEMVQTSCCSKRTAITAIGLLTSAVNTTILTSTFETLSNLVTQFATAHIDKYIKLDNNYVMQLYNNYSKFCSSAINDWYELAPWLNNMTISYFATILVNKITEVNGEPSMLINQYFTGFLANRITKEIKEGTSGLNI